MKWTSACEEAFLELKKSLTQAPVMACLDLQKSYILHVNASYDGFGGIFHSSIQE